MAKFIKADDITVPQSLEYTDGNYGTFGTGSEFLQVFKPHQGFDLLYKNPNTNQGSTEITEEIDDRFKLGTYTLNNRDYWENNNFNESNLQSYLKDDLEVLASIVVNTPDGDVVRNADDGIYNNSTQPYLWSIDALPFVINPNNDEIIHVDRYYDRDINKEEYELATEGKINYYLEARSSGRGAYNNNATGDNIDIFSTRGKRTKAGGQNYFDWLIKTSINDDSDVNDENGFYLFKLNWGDGSEIKYTSKPQLLESTTLLEHFYDNPGFYTISGLVYQLGTGLIRAWEKFETNILLNPSPNYKLKLFDYNNFASIGGISKDSAFVKSLYNLVGINPLTQVNDRASEDVIRNLNLMDKLQILNTLGKVDYSLIQPYWNLLAPYQTPTDDVGSFVFGCTQATAANYDENANIDDGTCIFIHEVTLKIEGDIPPINIRLVVNETTVEKDTPITVPRFSNSFRMGNNQSERLPAPGVPGGLAYYDYTFNGWFNENDELIGTDGDIEINVEILEDRTLFAKFTYQDATPPNAPIRIPDTVNNYLKFQDIAYNKDNKPNLTYVLDSISDNSISVFYYMPPQAGINYQDFYSVQISRSYHDYIQDTRITEPVTEYLGTDSPHGDDNQTTRAWNRYDDENLPYRLYRYQLCTIDTNGLRSDYIYSSDEYPTPSDTTPEAIPNESLSLEQVASRDLRFTWKQISEAWPGLEGNFKHFKIEVDGPNGNDYIYEYLGNYTGNQNEGLIPNTFQITQPTGLVQKGFIIPINGATDIGVGDEVNINNLPILPWKFKISVVGDTSENDESSATEFINITPANYVSYDVQVDYLESETSNVEPMPTNPPVGFNPMTGNFMTGTLSPQGEWRWTGQGMSWVAVETQEEETQEELNLVQQNGSLVNGVNNTISVVLNIPFSYTRQAIFNSLSNDPTSDFYINPYVRLFTKDLPSLPPTTYYGYEINLRSDIKQIPFQNSSINDFEIIYEQNTNGNFPELTSLIGRNLYVGVFEGNDTNLVGESLPIQIGDIVGCGNPNADNYMPLVNAGDVDGHGDYCTFSYKLLLENITENSGFQGTATAISMEFEEDDDTGELDYSKGYFKDGEIEGFEVQYEQIQIEDYEFILIAANDLGQNGIFKRWEIEDNQNGLLFTDQVSFDNNVLNINANSFTDNINDLNFLQNGGSPFSYLAVRPASTASPTNYEDKTIRVVWGESGLEYNEDVVEGQLGQNLNLALYGNPDVDDNVFGTEDYPIEPQPVEVYGAPFTGESGYENQSSLGFVGPTNFTLMANVVEYTEPGHPYEGSEIELYQRTIEAQPNEEFESDGVTYTQSFVRWEIKQGAEYIDKISSSENDNIVLVDNFINVSTYGESVNIITIEYSGTNFDSDTPIIIEGYFEQVDEDGNSGGGKQP